MTPNSLEAKIDVDFWSRVSVGDVDECWEWTGNVNRGRPVYVCASSPVAARTAYALYYERTPGKLLVLHSCDNGMCVNPGHLFLGTTADNIADKVAKGRQAKGKMFGRSDLNDDKVLDILKSYVGGESAKSLADRYEVDWQTIKDIFRRKSWKHVPWEDAAALAKTRAENMRFSKKVYVSESQAKEAVKRRAAGESYKLIALEYGVCSETLKRAVRRIAAEGGQSNAWDHPKRRDKLKVIVT